MEVRTLQKKKFNAVCLTDIDLQFCASKTLFYLVSLEAVMLQKL